MGRSHEEITRAHDTLRSIVLGENPVITVDADSEPDKLMRAQLDVLCWMLGHTHNQQFARNLESVNEEMSKHGFVLHPLPKGEG